MSKGGPHRGETLTDGLSSLDPIGLGVAVAAVGHGVCAGGVDARSNPRACTSIGVAQVRRQALLCVVRRVVVDRVMERPQIFESGRLQHGLDGDGPPRLWLVRCSSQPRSAPSPTSAAAVHRLGPRDGGPERDRLCPTRRFRAIDRLDDNVVDDGREARIADEGEAHGMGLGVPVYSFPQCDDLMRPEGAQNARYRVDPTCLPEE